MKSVGSWAQSGRTIMRSRSGRWAIAVALVLGCGPKVRPGLNVTGDRLQAKFDRPMVAADALGRDVTDGPMRSQPAVAGKLRWLDARTLAFVPAERLPGSTRFEVVVKAGTAALDGLGLPKAVRWSFETERLRVELPGRARAVGDPRPGDRPRVQPAGAGARRREALRLRERRRARRGGRRQHGRERGGAHALPGDPARAAGAGDEVAVRLRR